VSVEKFLLGPFLCKPKPSEVSLEFLGLENIPQVLGNLSKVGLNNAARKAV